MHDEMAEQAVAKVISLAFQTINLTVDEFDKLIQNFLSQHEQNKISNKSTQTVIPHGKMSVKELAAQNKGMQNIVINSKNSGTFSKVAKKYGVDFAIKKDSSTKPPTYNVFFKGQDVDAITAAFKEYSAKVSKKASKSHPILDTLSKLKEAVKDIPQKVNERFQNRER